MSLHHAPSAKSTQREILADCSETKMIKSESSKFPSMSTLDGACRQGMSQGRWASSVSYHMTRHQGKSVKNSLRILPIRDWNVRVVQVRVRVGGAVGVTVCHVGYTRAERQTRGIFCRQIIRKKPLPFGDHDGSADERR
eukprot:scaffold227_cov165-Amphora_coffeaeformis.AAC.20